MKPHLLRLLLVLLLAGVARGAAKPHVIAFGKWITVKWLADSEARQNIDMKIRALVVDGHAKDFTTGLPHEVTEQILVVRRMVRLNDSLPSEPSPPAHWVWHPAGWVVVNRMTGRVSAASLPQFDPITSEASWYRDYAAYCGASDDGRKLFAMVVELGRRKPILAKLLRDTKSADPDDTACATPIWQRQPTRVTFAIGKDEKFTYTVREAAVTLAADEGDEE